MYKMKIIIILFLEFLLFTITYGWNHYAVFPGNEMYEEKFENSKLSNSTEYCYHFTWMGEKFNNRTFKNIRNKTCSQYVKDKKILCINPMVATHNGTEPDINYILKNHPVEATCRLSQGQICAKYTVSNHGIVSYQTRYCTIVNVELEGTMKAGCITEKRGTELIEVCVCKSQPGPKGICNFGNAIFLSQILLFSSVFWTFIVLYKNIL